ncbi:phosphatase PAP2 family protein [Pseudoduganella sp. UC29_106]|uniref:phosphatase PAP2 family protein n=1 Tax=Pseudoduganella sp. UC29_106 TaxID=3374553 RepID=UPI0037583054
MHASTAYKSGIGPATLAVSVLGISALFILWLGQATNIDLQLADAAYDQARQLFPLQHAWFAEQFNHEILKKIMTVAAVGAVLLALYDSWRPFKGWDWSHRIGVRVLGMSALFVPLLTSLLKRSSSSHCPWDLQRYGGDAPYIRILELMPHGVSAGHCLPGGHASSTLWLIALSAFWWPKAPRKALAVGLAALVLGFGVGWVQQLRGAHFLTHTLWSCWVACAVVFAVYQLNTKVLAKVPSISYSSVPRNAATAAE